MTQATDMERQLMGDLAAARVELGRLTTKLAEERRVAWGVLESLVVHLQATYEAIPVELAGWIIETRSELQSRSDYRTSG